MKGIIKMETDLKKRGKKKRARGDPRGEERRFGD